MIGRSVVRVGPARAHRSPGHDQRRRDRRHQQVQQEWPPGSRRQLRLRGGGGQLQQLQRKKHGNLSVRSLADVVHKEDFVDTQSEYLETLLVAVPKNNAKDWQARYERLTAMVVTRSSNKLAADDE